MARIKEACVADVRRLEKAVINLYLAQNISNARELWDASERVLRAKGNWPVLPLHKYRAMTTVNALRERKDDDAYGVFSLEYSRKGGVIDAIGVSWEDGVISDPVEVIVGRHRGARVDEGFGVRDWLSRNVFYARVNGKDYSFVRVAS